MAVFGRIRRRLALATLLTALIPVLVAIWLAESAVRHASERFFMPEIGIRLDQSLELYQELARAVKAGMRAEAQVVAADHRLRKAAAERDAPSVRAHLQRLFKQHPSLVSLRVEGGGDFEVEVDRGRPLDPENENRLVVTRSLGETMEDGEDVDVELTAVFSADRARFDQLEGMSQFVNTYKQIETRRRADERSYVYALAVLLGITIIAAVGVGTFFARGVTVRIDELAEATHRVGAGDLSVRVKARGADEIADFARAFNRMLAEVEASRARIEYLQRIGAWQGMARRLAHEIKNPLTPIQLAVQEIHRRYQGQDPEYEKLLDTSLEIVEDEVGTLRRLVTEFSDFARLPRADLADADLREFLERQRERLTLGDDEARDSERDSQLDLAPGVGLGFDLPKDGKPAMVLLDHLMFRRVLINLVRNAMQAIGPAGAGKGEVRVSLRRSGNYWEIDVDDNGPGIDPDLHGAVFDPYVTSKNEGTGLGLAIVKKIVMEHGGTVRALDGPLGGARVEVKLPALGTPPALALLEARKAPDSAPHSDRVLP
jgi:nitrogen fixation/metabolism regulation signal transduction histidine kinase